MVFTPVFDWNSFRYDSPEGRLFFSRSNPIVHRVLCVWWYGDMVICLEWAITNLTFFLVLLFLHFMEYWAASVFGVDFRSLNIAIGSCIFFWCSRAMIGHDWYLDEYNCRTMFTLANRCNLFTKITFGWQTDRVTDGDEWYTQNNSHEKSKWYGNENRFKWNVSAQNETTPAVE